MASFLAAATSAVVAATERVKEGGAQAGVDGDTDASPGEDLGTAVALTASVLAMLLRLRHVGDRMLLRMPVGCVDSDDTPPLSL